MIGFVDDTMRPELRVYRGRWGSVHELPKVPPREGMPEQVATLSHWFVSSPAAHPVWPHYLFLTVRLRDVEGQSRPPTKPFPDATHNIMLVALNPEIGPWTAENVTEKMLAPRDQSAFLTPLNASEFVGNATDAQAIELTHLLARAMVDGIVPIEPGDWGRARWTQCIASTMEHIQTGGHRAAAEAEK
jgi:hypothetical protein